jgi:ParB/RepB/Spo0J family partition protein
VGQGHNAGMTSTHCPPKVQDISVEAIHLEPGLSRKRDQAGHRELQRSIAQFGVLNPVTVRATNDGSGAYLLVKGQGRTLACRLLGIESIPAIVVDSDFATRSKVQQFLVENVARLRMTAADRALLVARARKSGEETQSVARRFGISATTVRRLQQQLTGAGRTEIRALQNGSLSLSVQAVIARRASAQDREAMVAAFEHMPAPASKLAYVLDAIGWSELNRLGPEFARERVSLWKWLLEHVPWRRNGRELLGEIAASLPSEIQVAGSQ